jgi:hypothetical protein
MRSLILAVGLFLAPLPSSGQTLDSPSEIRIQETIKLAEQGNAEAQEALGRAYAHGYDIAEDKSKAAYWYRMAAMQGNSDAQGALGVAYANGQGVPLDYATAYMWYNISAANSTGFEADNSSWLRDDIAKKMTRADISEAQLRSRQCIKTHYQDCN